MATKLGQMSAQSGLQQYLVMAINAERAAAGMTIKQLAATAGLNERTLLRVLHLERAMTVDQVAKIAVALGVSVSALTGDAEKRMTQHPSVAQRISELRFRLDHESGDQELIHRIAGARNVAGMSDSALESLEQGIRSHWRQDLEAQISALLS